MEEIENWPTIIFVFVLILLLINPIRACFRPFRYESLYATYNTIISPIGPVRFKDFFLGDILTSATRPLADGMFVVCYFSYKQGPNESIGPSWIDQRISNDQCNPSKQTILIVSILPFWFRFWQCINKYYHTKLFFPHIVNAGKYLAGIILIFFTFLKAVYQQSFSMELYLGWAIFSTLYSYVWDITVDWGLMTGKNKKKDWQSFFLRDRLKYPPNFYYFSAFTNFILRFSWVFNLVDIEMQRQYLNEDFIEINGIFYTLAILEAYRRAQWSLFRVENENINNYEKYRIIQEIPKVLDYEDELE